MQTVLMQLGVGIAAFASTDLDDLLVLLALFLDRKIRPGEVVLGQFLGIGTLVAASLAASLTSLWLSREVIGLLGLVPLVMGLFRLRGVFGSGADGDDDEEAPPPGPAALPGRSPSQRSPLAMAATISAPTHRFLPSIRALARCC